MQQRVKRNQDNSSHVSFQGTKPPVHKNLSSAIHSTRRVCGSGLSSPQSLSSCGLASRGSRSGGQRYTDGPGPGAASAEAAPNAAPPRARGWVRILRRCAMTLSGSGSLTSSTQRHERVVPREQGFVAAPIADVDVPGKPLLCVVVANPRARPDWRLVMVQ